MKPSSPASDSIRHLIRVNGTVQGVGFRPFVYRLAREHELVGSVGNDSQGVWIEVEGCAEGIAKFETSLLSEAPPLARITDHSIKGLDLKSEESFEIVASHHLDNASTSIPPDIGLCEDCRRELFDPSDRRFRYPFINCTNCGPRFTIVRALPYDRPGTSMQPFPMCSACASEYRDPTDRRFHAQPVACPECGPKVWLHDGQKVVSSDDPIGRVVSALKQGLIVALRGLGGFHLACDAKNEAAVRTLRERKGRDEKPFALMGADLATVIRLAHVSQTEEDILLDPIRPILILAGREDHPLARSISLDNPEFGFMLPYTPLHELIMNGNFDALVMTSGNLSDEPIAIGNDEGLERLNGIADLFLLHDREIVQRCDDSIARVTGGIARPIRRARGYVPVPVISSIKSERSILAVGGELKNCVGISRNREICLGQHVGDLDNPKALDFFEETINHLQSILEVSPALIACDMHPEYLSTKWAHQQADIPVIEVQHHHAHLASVLTENHHEGKAIGLILDGTGYGQDESIWGGEILVGDAEQYERAAWLRPVPMPGGSQAIKQPWRMGLAYQLAINPDTDRRELFGVPDHLSAQEFGTIREMITRQLNSPLTSSCGRLFDGVAAILGLKSEIGYEAQAAIMLESSARRGSDLEDRSGCERFIESKPCGALDWTDIIRLTVEMRRSGRPKEQIAYWFHTALVELFTRAATGLREKHAINCVGLSGGVYQNRLFLELMISRLRELEFEILTHREVPTNDGGLALGQIAVAAAQTK